ncbi:MAG: type II toxin-antitoxin system mRNA interferase toxin, RelE/StbE family [Candidatus Levyibacteriota bacterium]
MKVKFSPLVQQKLTHLYKKDKKLFIRIEKQIKLFESNPKHPSLRIHKLTGNLTNRWSISISKGLRMVYVVLNEDIAYFVDLGTHDEVYRK